MLARQAGRRAASVKFTCQKKNKKMYTWPVQRQHENIVVRRPGNMDAAFAYRWPQSPLFFVVVVFLWQKNLLSIGISHYSFLPSLPPLSTHIIKCTLKPRANTSWQRRACASVHILHLLPWFKLHSKKSKTPQNKQEFPLNRVSTNFDWLYKAWGKQEMHSLLCLET